VSASVRRALEIFALMRHINSRRFTCLLAYLLNTFGCYEAHINITTKLRLVVRPKLHYTDTGYGHVVQQHQQATDTTNGQRTSSQQYYNKFATSQCQSPTSRHVKMLGCGKVLSVCGDFVVQQVVELL